LGGRYESERKGKGLSGTGWVRGALEEKGRRHDGRGRGAGKAVAGATKGGWGGAR
jgi:hypothetical protein